jgi:hypothetical protein
MQKLFEGGKGNVFQRVLSWIPSNNHQLQLAGALAIANFARNGKHISSSLVNQVFCIFKIFIALLSITCTKRVQKFVHAASLIFQKLEILIITLLTNCTFYVMLTKY